MWPARRTYTWCSQHSDPTDRGSQLVNLEDARSHGEPMFATIIDMVVMVTITQMVMSSGSIMALMI